MSRLPTLSRHQKAKSMSHEWEQIWPPSHNQAHLNRLLAKIHPTKDNYAPKWKPRVTAYPHGHLTSPIPLTGSAEQNPRYKGESQKQKPTMIPLLRKLHCRVGQTGDFEGNNPSTTMPTEPASLNSIFRAISLLSFTLALITETCITLVCTNLCHDFDKSVL